MPKTSPLIFLFFFILTPSCPALVLNNPYSAPKEGQTVYYSSFSEQPKTLDPARSYSANESQFIQQIYEPLLQYDYFIRPYTLIPLLAKTMPSIRYLDKDAKETIEEKVIAYSVYHITIKPDIFYQPHPAFAKNSQGEYIYLNLPRDYLTNHKISELSDFKYVGTRAVCVDDFIYQIKRLATPLVNSPIYGLMGEHILGFKDFAKQLPTTASFVDLRRYTMTGLKKINEEEFEITLKGQYAQFMFWLAMTFFAPSPWEVDCFYAQKGMKEKNLTWDWYPAGTGPFMLQENNPNRRMILVKNPQFRQEFFPENASPEDKAKGYALHVGKRIPLIDKAIYLLEKESIPRWNKFLQGYYDLSAISNESFDQAIQITPSGHPILTASLKNKKMRLIQTHDPAIFYLGFNMLDPIVGGLSDKARKLRLAISIALDYEENIAIFLNGRGSIAHGPIPPGVFGFTKGKAGINPFVYHWETNKAQRLPLAVAKRLMREAGYPNGIDPKTGKALILYYDVAATAGPDDKSSLDWMRKQFAKLGIDLNIRSTLYNRFQDKLRTGNAQLFSWGWSADYPDPENFLAMFYAKNSMVKYGGENATNYANPIFDQLFDAMKNKPNNKERLDLLDKIQQRLRFDAPWVFGFFPNTLVLAQDWVYPVKPSALSYNTLKYIAIDLDKRKRLRKAWNQAILWPLGGLFILFIVLLVPVFYVYYRKERKSSPRIP